MCCAQTVQVAGIENNTETFFMVLRKLMLKQHIKYCVQYSKEQTRKAGEK